MRYTSSFCLCDILQSKGRKITHIKGTATYLRVGHPLVDRVPRFLGPTAELPMDLTIKWAPASQGEKRIVSLGGNPWVRPPRSVMSRGLMSAESWWKDVTRFGEGTSNKLKCLLVGLAEAGKTTIVRQLTGRVSPEKRTIGVEVTEWKPRDDLPLSVSLWDFAGQPDYYASHQIFLTDGALVLLVVDLFELERDAAKPGEISDPRGAMFRWLDILHQRVPGAVVALVGTHGDKFFCSTPGSPSSFGTDFSRDFMSHSTRFQDMQQRIAWRSQVLRNWMRSPNSTRE